MIPQSNISRLSNRLAKGGGRRIPETVLERDYCIAWFLVGLSQASLKSKLGFKGGTALKRCHFDDYRFSEDLDFTLLSPLTFEELKNELEIIYPEVHRLSGVTFRFSKEDTHTHQNSFTFYLGYEGPLPSQTSGKEVKVDVTIKECLVFPVEEHAILRSYEEYTDLPKGKKILAYSLNEIAAGKIVTLLDRARTEPRDLYDLWFLMSQKKVVIEDLEEAVKQKLDFRKKKIEDVREEFEKKEARLKKAWQTRLLAQMVELPEFDGVYRALKRTLRQAGLT